MATPQAQPPCLHRQHRADVVHLQLLACARARVLVWEPHVVGLWRPWTALSPRASLCAPACESQRGSLVCCFSPFARSRCKKVWHSRMRLLRCARSLDTMLLSISFSPRCMLNSSLCKSMEREVYHLHPFASIWGPLAYTSQRCWYPGTRVDRSPQAPRCGVHRVHERLSWPRSISITSYQPVNWPL